MSHSPARDSCGTHDAAREASAAAYLQSLQLGLAVSACLRRGGIELLLQRSDRLARPLELRLVRRLERVQIGLVRLRHLRLQSRECGGHLLDLREVLALRMGNRAVSVMRKGKQCV
jgi:hypothetical protein